MSLYDRFKSGRGISKEEAEKRNYFGILFRKLSKISQASLIYSLCNLLFLVMILLSVVMTLLYYRGKMQEIGEYLSLLLNGKQLLPIYFFIPCIFMGPGTAGLTYIMCNFSKQKHAFVWSDFWEYTKRFLGRGLLISFILTALFYFYINACIFYLNSNINMILILVLEIGVGILLIMASFYVYPLLVTFDIKVRDALVYSAILAIGNYPKNFLVVIALFIVHGLMIVYALPLWFTLMPVILFGWTSYTINYVTVEAIDKLLLNK